jgi:hypothetical protein
MARSFDLRKQLKLHDNGLLRRLFADQREMECVDWSSLRKHEVEPIAAAWEAMMEARRRYFQVILLDVNELSDARGQKVLVEELSLLFPDKLAAFQSCASPADKALWAYLEVRPAFDAAAIFARAEAMRGGNYSNRWIGMPKDAIAVDETMIASLQDAVCEYYWKKELRGRVCRVHHYKRAGGAEYFFAYLPDWPDKLLVFDENNNLTPREESYTFNNVFIYVPSEGAIELIAKGGKPVQKELRKAFCRTVLKGEVEDAEPDKPSYQLDHLLASDFAFTTESLDRIADVRLRRIRLAPKTKMKAIEHLEFKFTEVATRSEAMDAILRDLAAHKLERGQVRVTQVGIQLVFHGDGERKPKTMTFNVSTPNNSDLRTRPDDARVIGERCIKRWEILCD